MRGELELADTAKCANSSLSLCSQPVSLTYPLKYECPIRITEVQYNFSEKLDKLDLIRLSDGPHGSVSLAHFS